MRLGIRRTLLRGARLACLGLAVAGCPAASAQSLQFTVSDRAASRYGSTVPVAPVPPAFVGASMDYCQLPAYTGGRASSVLTRLLLNLAPSGPLIRVGGFLGEPCPAGVRPLAAAPSAIAALARATRAKLILGAELAYGAGARSAVASLVQAISPRRPSRFIDAFEIGNEPDLQHRYGAFGPAAQIDSNFSRYLRDFSAQARAIRGIVRDPLLGIAGPTLTEPTSPWIAPPRVGNFLTFVGSAARPNPITLHTYPLRGTARCPGKLCASISNLLLDRSSHGLAEDLARFAALLPPGQVLRVDEMNSVTSGGVAGVSNTFASALWGLDTLFEYLRAGINGVNVHTFNGAAYELYGGPSPDGWVVFPEYFGLLAFARAAPAGAQLLGVDRSPAARAVPAVKVWATRAPDGTLTIVVINKSPAAQKVVLRGPGVPVKRGATLERLLAPAGAVTPLCPAAYAPTGLCATSGVTLGGAAFGPAGTGALGGEVTQTGSLQPAPARVCSLLARCTHQPAGGAIELAVPAGSAAFVSGRVSGRASGPASGPSRPAPRRAANR